MKLQRYLLKDSDKGEYFGPHFTENRWDFDWYLGENKIGITGKPSTEAECFIGGFLVKDDVLLLKPSKEHPKISRKSDSFASMSGHSSGRREIQDLIELLMGQEVSHVYLSSEREDGTYAGILTFSPTAPSEKLYRPAAIMPVELNKWAIEQEKRELEMIAKSNNISHRVLQRLASTK